MLIGYKKNQKIISGFFILPNDVIMPVRSSFALKPLSVRSHLISHYAYECFLVLPKYTHPAVCIPCILLKSS